MPECEHSAILDEIYPKEDVSRYGRYSFYLKIRTKCLALHGIITEKDLDSPVGGEIKLRNTRRPVGVFPTEPPDVRLSSDEMLVKERKPLCTHSSKSEKWPGCSA